MKDEDFNKEEAQRRFEATLRGALTTPPQPRPTKPSLPKKKLHASSAHKASANAGTDRP
jgi:hypothetical protein